MRWGSRRFSMIYTFILSFLFNIVASFGEFDRHAYLPFLGYVVSIWARSFIDMGFPSFFNNIHFSFVVQKYVTREAKNPREYNINMIKIPSHNTIFVVKHHIVAWVNERHDVCMDDTRRHVTRNRPQREWQGFFDSLEWLSNCRGKFAIGKVVFIYL